jgi:hypothetical protein
LTYSKNQEIRFTKQLAEGMSFTGHGFIEDIYTDSSGTVHLKFWGIGGWVAVRPPTIIESF